MRLYTRSVMQFALFLIVALVFTLFYLPDLHLFAKVMTIADFFIDNRVRHVIGMQIRISSQNFERYSRHRARIVLTIEKRDNLTSGGIDEKVARSPIHSRSSHTSLTQVVRFCRRKRHECLQLKLH